MAWPFDDLAGAAQFVEGLTNKIAPFLDSAKGAQWGIEASKQISRYTGFDPFDIFGDPIAESSSASPASPQGLQGSGAAEVFAGGMTGGGGASAMYGNGFPLVLTGPRRIVPYSGGVIPSGYRVAQRPGRRPTAGYPGGVYLVPRRSMNPLNPRALMRAERRMNAFTTWVKRHFRIASAAPKRRKTVGKRRRR